MPKKMQKLIIRIYLGRPTFSLTIMDGLNKACIVPVLNHIIGAVMNLDFDCISTIVNKEYYGPLPAADHC